MQLKERKLSISQIGSSQKIKPREVEPKVEVSFVKRLAPLPITDSFFLHFRSLSLSLSPLMSLCLSLSFSLGYLRSVAFE